MGLKGQRAVDKCKSAAYLSKLCWKNRKAMSLDIFVAISEFERRLWRETPLPCRIKKSPVAEPMRGTDG